MDEAGRVTVAELNASSVEDFCKALEGIWEHSPWVVEAVVNGRPFESLDALMAAMWSVVNAATEDRQLGLLLAHPDLAGKLAQSPDLTVESAREQASAGLDRLTRNEVFAFMTWNGLYRQRFGFPFIVCVRSLTKNDIRKAFRKRLANTGEQELATALGEVRKIADARLRDRVSL